jgi:hypothetical protein
MIVGVQVSHKCCAPVSDKVRIGPFYLVFLIPIQPSMKHVKSKKASATIRRMKSPRYFCAVIAAGIALHAAAVEVDISDISGTNYFPAVHTELQQAERSIDIAMYHVRVYPHSTTNSPTLTLVQDLIAAHERGVKVNVTLDNSFRYNPQSGSKRISDKNRVSAEMLTAAGITVRFAPSFKTMHQKLIVIDSKIVITGSHNWSDTALKYNLESSDLIRSAEYAAIKLEQMAELPREKEGIATKRRKRHEEGTEGRGSFFAVATELLTSPGLAARMISKRDNRAFDLYMLLSSVSTNGPIVIDYDSTAEELGMDMGMGRTAYRRQITKTLRKLERTYNLIKCDFKWGKPAVVTLRDSGNSERQIKVPAAYLEYGWSRKLSLSAKNAYLICLTEQELSENAPWWSLSRDALAKKYPGNRDTIGRGLLELEAEDLVEIIRSNIVPGEGFESRRPNRYRLKPLLSEEDIEKQWQALADVYGAKKLAKARELAGMLDRQNNRDVAANFLRVMEIYGFEQTKRATAIVAEMARDNPCRHAGYVVRLLKSSQKQQ